MVIEHICQHVVLTVSLEALLYVADNALHTIRYVVAMLLLTCYKYVTMNVHIVC